jgi:DNA polymerase-3 subunit gamma/tau
MESWPVKYRPTKFEEVIGQDVVVSILKAVVQDQKVPAVLLCGRSGVGKTTILRIYAHNLLYPGKEFSSLENDPDFLELDASTSGGVGSLRELADTIEHKPMTGRYRFVLFDEVHAVTKDGYNVLLKMIEEPHAHVRFGFATTNPEKVPGTILGRSMVFSLRPVNRDLMTSKVRSVASSERLSVDDEVVNEIVRLSDGQVRDALKLLQQISSVENPTAGMVRELEGLSSAVTDVDFLRALMRKEVIGSFFR